MCHLPMTLRYDLTKDLIMTKPGVYYSAEALVEYWEQRTGTRVSETHVPGVFQAFQRNGVSVHNANKSWCFETEEIRTHRLEKEAQIKEARLLAQSEKDNLIWAKKRQRRDELKAMLAEAERDLASFENDRQDSILLREHLKRVA